MEIDINMMLTEGGKVSRKNTQANEKLSRDIKKKELIQKLGWTKIQK